MTRLEAIHRMLDGWTIGHNGNNYSRMFFDTRAKLFRARQGNAVHEISDELNWVDGYVVATSGSDEKLERIGELFKEILNIIEEVK